MPRRKPLDWPTAIELYTTHLAARNCAARTVYTYRLTLLRLRDHLGTLRDDPAPGRVTLEQLRAYLAGLQSGETSRSGQPNSVRTVHGVSSTLRSFFSWLTDEQRIKADPTRRLELPRRPRALPGDVLSIHEVERLLASPDMASREGPRDRALLELLYATGLRRGEALALDLGDLDARERVVYVRHGKGDKGRVVPLTRSAWEQVQRYLQQGRLQLVTEHSDGASAVFLSSLGRRLSEVSVLRILRRHAETAGIPRLTPHVLRRSCATHLLKAGVSLRHIQVLLGHAKLSTTAVYLKLDTSELRRELLLKHPRESLDA